LVPLLWTWIKVFPLEMKIGVRSSWDSDLWLFGSLCWSYGRFQPNNIVGYSSSFSLVQLRKKMTSGMESDSVDGAVFRFSSYL